MSQLQNYTVTPIANATVTDLQRWNVSANVINDAGVDLGVFSFNWPDIWKQMTAAQRQRIAEVLAPAILKARAGLDPEL